ncbi:MAG: inositol monophosphatase [Marmoricola sp.]|nr:inositol monophosphatase [Marmoricola sp.]
MSSAESPPDSPDALLALAVATAREAGDLVASMRADGVDVADTKSSPVDIVTKADRTCEELIRSRLLGARPGDGFVGEEGSDVPSATGVSWIVDPIDGTVNYLYGLPQYAVSIAAARDGKIVAGVVRSPALDLEYAATLGGGATRNGVPVRVRSTPPLDQALVATGFSYVADIRARQGLAVAKMLPQVRDIRRHGSCALDLCAVASGQSDAYVEEGANIWDYAAGGLVAEEAGATFEVWTSVADRDVVVCAPNAGWAEFAALVRSCGFLGD